jgi:hypothetical protein
MAQKRVVVFGWLTDDVTLSLHLLIGLDQLRVDRWHSHQHGDPGALERIANPEREPLPDRICAVCDKNAILPLLYIQVSLRLS